jgi:hypothetical protein
MIKPYLTTNLIFFDLPIFTKGKLEIGKMYSTLFETHKYTFINPLFESVWAVHI